DEPRHRDQLVEREERRRRAEALQEVRRLREVARGGAGQAEAGNAVVEGATQLTADRAETDDAHVHDARMLSCLRHWNDGSATSAAAGPAPPSRHRVTLPQLGS